MLKPPTPLRVRTPLEALEAENAYLRHHLDRVIRVATFCTDPHSTDYGVARLRSAIAAAKRVLAGQVHFGPTPEVGNGLAYCEHCNASPGYPCINAFNSKEREPHPGRAH